MRLKHSKETSEKSGIDNLRLLRCARNDLTASDLSLRGAQRRSNLSFSEATKANRRYKGLSIIEVAMASVLLIVAMVPILKSLTKANMLSSSVERKTQCLVLAQGKLDDLRARSIYNFDSIVSLNNAAFPGTSYLCNITVSNVTPPNPDLKQITVSVGYDENGNGTLTDDKIEVALTTCFARRW